LTDARRESDKASPDRLGLASSEPSARLLVEEAEASEGTAVENGFPPLTTLGGKEVDNGKTEVKIPNQLDPLRPGVALPESRN